MDALALYRVKSQTKSFFKFAAVLALGVIAGGFVFSRMRDLRRGGERASVWFYDESQKRLYAAPDDTIPPHEGCGGKPDDGVRAVVVAFRGEERDSRKRRIAYLEIYTAELKALLEQARAARASGRVLGGQMPTRDSDYFQSHTLVRRVEESDWHAVNSAEGLRITSEWRAWRGPEGQAPVVCVP